MFVIIHYLHVTIAAIWAGSVVFVGLAVWPMVAKLPLDQARDLFARLKPVVAGVMGSMAGVTYLLGGFRAWIGGGIAGWGDLATSYGMLVIGAFVIMMAIESVGGRFRRQLARLLEQPDGFALHAPGIARRAGLIQTALLAVLIAIMITMGLALY